MSMRARQFPASAFTHFRQRTMTWRAGHASRLLGAQSWMVGAVLGSDSGINVANAAL
jgi:hypothetical protein